MCYLAKIKKVDLQKLTFYILAIIWQFSTFGLKAQEINTVDKVETLTEDENFYVAKNLALEYLNSDESIVEKEVVRLNYALSYAYGELNQLDSAKYFLDLNINAAGVDSFSLVIKLNIRRFFTRQMEMSLKCIKAFSRAVQISELKDDRPNQFKSLANLAFAYASSGDFSNSEDCIREADSLRSIYFPSDHLKQIKILIIRSAPYAQRGNYQRALDYIKKAKDFI